MEPKSFSPIDDVPEAQRDTQLQVKQSTQFRGIRRWIGWFLVGLLSAVAGLVVSWMTYQDADETAVIPLEPIVNFSTPGTVNPSGLESSQEKSLLGHRAHEEAAESDLAVLTTDASIQLRPSAAAKFDAMVAEAETQGIYLVPLSGFRSIEDQQYLFFEVKAERGQNTTTRAEVSAPPGYSEHHTGYAIDIGDANFPDANLQIKFEDTPAFEWLKQNAAGYSFELSFPEKNPQGIQYEPWHWRFVGDSHSLETFYQDR
ncbi:MAG: M15 family metallopeptidase [Leptolyngbya sp. SIO1D8]|nr:M15 family metallopeptidase [Leptolyngbya sp. SIO1D8]